MPTQTEAQRQAALQAAGLTSAQQSGVAAGTGYSSPKISDIYGSVPQSDTDLSTLTAGLYSQASSPVDEANIRKDIMDRLQKEIDATDRIFEGRIAEARVAGLNRTGQATAINSRRGLVGSDFGTAINNNVEAANTAVVDGINNERNAELARLRSGGEKSVSEELAAQRLARQQGADKYLSFLKETESRREARTLSAAQLALASGVDLSTASADELKQLAESYNVDPATLTAAYQSAAAAKAQADAEIADLQAQTAGRKPDEPERYIELSDGESLYDTTTGKIVSENVKNYAPKAPAGGTGSGGSGGVGGGTFKSDLDALISNTYNLIPSLNGKNAFKASVNGARNEADKINAIATVVLKNSSADLRNDFVNQSAGIRNLDKAIALIDNNTKTGVLQNAAQYTYNLAGKDFDPKVAAINAYITAAIQPYRSSITGAAWGEQEDAEYANLFGSAKYSPAELKSRLVRIKEIMADKSANALQAQVNPMGGGYDPFVPGGGSSATPAGPSASFTQTQARAKYNY